MPVARDRDHEVERRGVTQTSRQRLQTPLDGLADVAGLQAIDLADQRKATFAIDQRHQSAPPLLADDRVAFPIAKTAAFFDNRRTPRDVGASGNFAACFWFCAALAQPEERLPVLPLRTPRDPTIDAGVRDRKAVVIHVCQTSGDLLGGLPIHQTQKDDVTEVGIIIKVRTRLTPTGLSLRLRSQSVITIGLAVAF